MRRKFEAIRSILEAALTLCLSLGVLGVTGLTVGAALFSGAPIA
jgi:hypothetical protein